MALAVQLLRGKLWLLGAAGVWGLLALTLLTAGVSLGLDNLARIRMALVGVRAKTSPYGVGVALLTLFGLGLRLGGQQMGLPYIIPADESLFIDAGTRFIKTGNFDPQMYYYPGFYVYVQAVVAGLHFLGGSFTGLYHGVEDLPDRTFAITTAPQFYLWGRTLTALMGTAAIPIAYFLVKRVWQDRRAGVLAAGFIALSSLAVENSHYIAVDIPMATFVLAALWSACGIYERGYRRDYALTGVICGLAIGTKWSAFAVLILPIVAHLLRLRQNRSALNPPPYYLLLSFLTTALTVLATTPFIFARIKEYSDIFVIQLLKYQSTDALRSVTYPWQGNLQVIWDDSWLLFGLGLGGIVLLAFRRWAADWLALSFPLLYLLSMNGYRLIYPRNVLPLTYYLAIFAALFSLWIFDRVAARLPDFKLNKVGRWAAGLVLPLLFVGITMWGALTTNLYANDLNDRPYSYARAEEWLKAEVGPGPIKLVEMRPQQWGSYPNLLARVAETGANDLPLSYYRERGIQYLAINRERARDANFAGSYLDLLEGGLVVKEFETKAVGQPGPPFAIVRTGVKPATLKLNFDYNADFGGKLRLLGVNTGKLTSANSLYLPPENQARHLESWPDFKPGDIIGLSIYWEVNAPLGQDYTVFIHLRPLGKPDTNVANRDTLPLLGAYPTSRWKPGEIVTDNPNLALPANLPPGDYTLVIGLYLNDGKFTPLPLVNGASSLTLGQIKVGR